MDGSPLESAAGLTYPCGEPPAAGTVKAVAEGVLWLRMPLPFSLKWINLWLLRDTGGWVIVDTGLGLEESRIHWRSVLDQVLEPGDRVTRIVVTHMHPDHVGLAGWLSRKHGAPLLMTRLEYITCRMLVADTGREAPEDGVSFYRAAGWDEDALDTYRVKFGGFGRVVSTLPDSYQRISDGNGIEIGGRVWQVLTGAGHCPEHACLWQPELEVFISGDQVLPRISSNVSVFPTEPDADPLSEWLASCADLRDRVPDSVLVLPAHNEPFHGLHARLGDLADGHERALVRLRDWLETPRTAVDCLSVLFRRPVTGDVLSMATGEAIAHLNTLVTRGLARRSRDETGLWRWQKV